MMADADVMGRVLGPAGRRPIRAGLALSAFGFLELVILVPPRVFQAMAADGVFFQPLARLHPRYRTPAGAIAFMGAWSIVLALSGTYAQLLDYVVFGDWIFFGLTVASLFIYRRRDLTRVPPLHVVERGSGGEARVLAAAYVVVSSIIANPRNALIGTGLLALGLPVYRVARRNQVLLRSAVALLCLTGSLAAQDSTFVLTTTDPTYRAPAFLGNGAFSLVGMPLGTTPSLSFAAGVYDHAPGDVPRIAALPAWNEIDVSDGDGWLNETRPDTRALQNYRQTLDLYDGTLSTSYEWVHGAKRTIVEVTAFVSRADANLAVIRVRLVPQYAGRVTLRFPLREWPPPRRLALARRGRGGAQGALDSVWFPGPLGGAARDSLAILARAGGGTSRVAVAQQLTWSARLRHP